MNEDEGRLAGLQSEDEEIRLQAVRSLGGSGDQRFLGPLVEAMGDPSWRVRKEAADALLQFDSEKAVELLLPGLRDGTNAGRRNSVVEVLIRFGSEVVPLISGLLKDDDQDVRKFVVDILGGINAPEVVPLLIGALEDEDENVVAASVEYLGLKGDLRSVKPLLTILNRGSFWLRYCSLRAVGQLATAKEEREIASFLNDPSLKQEAVEIITRIGGEASFADLIENHRQGGAREREKILGAMAAVIARAGEEEGKVIGKLAGMIRDGGLTEEFDSYLCRAMESGGPEERRTAFRISGSFPSSNVMGGLLAAMEEADEDDQEEISRALAAFPEEYMPLMFPHLAADQRDVRRQVARIFGDRRYMPALSRLLPLIKDDDGHVRASVTKALGQIGDKSAIMPIVDLLGDPYPDVRSAACRALTEMASGDAETGEMIGQFISKALDSTDERVTESSLQVLCGIADDSSVTLFARFLKDPRSRIRRVALNGLAVIQSEASVDLIVSALTDEDPDIRQEAVRRLGQSGREQYLEAIMAMVEDENDMVGGEALRALGHFRGEKVFEVLRREAGRPTGLKQLAAVKALCRLDGEKEMEVLTGLLTASDPEIRKEIVGFLGGIGSPGQAGIILPLLDDGDWSVRLAAVEALGRIHDEEIVHLVKDKYYPREKDPLVRQAMESLSRPGN
jgi:HEAT repeat protein